MLAMTRLWKTALIVVAMTFGGVGLTACHTVEGMGRDVQAIGGGVEDAADETRFYE